MDKQLITLLKTQGYIDGAWVGTPALPVIDKATGEEIARVPDMGAAETNAAIEAAHRAFKPWAARLAKDRSRILRRWYDLIVEHADELALLLTKEQGKPLAEAKGEIIYGAAFVELFAEEAKRIYGETIPTHKADARIVIMKQPVGVVAAITPWNFPSAMITRKVAPALAVGCTVVVKPAEDTPLSALALVELAERAGLPKGVLNVVTAKNPVPVGKSMTENPLVRMVTFTGSTEVGKILMAQAAGTVKRVGMELGGNAPFIVFDDADLDKAVAGAMASKFRNAGQTCVCANRILVQDTVYDAFAEKLAAAARDLKVGPGTEAGVTVGPLINADAVKKVERARRGRGEEGRSCGHGRQAACARWHLLRADDPDRRHAADARRVARRRLGRWHRCSSSRPRPRRSAWQTTPPSGSPPTSFRATSAAAGAWRKRSSTASSASTRGSRQQRSRRSADSRRAASAARARTTASMSSSRSSTH